MVIFGFIKSMKSIKEKNYEQFQHVLSGRSNRLDQGIHVCYSAIEIFENNIANLTATSKGAGNANTEVNMTDVDSSTTNYLSIITVEASSVIYGGYVTIARI